MTTAKPRPTAIAVAKPPPVASHFRLPDPELRQDEKMTNAKHLSRTGNYHHLVRYLGNPETTIVGSELYLVAAPTRNMAGARYPDLLIALNADAAAYEMSNGYIISDQGKPPDFVLEIASPSTGRIDVTAKRDDYAAWGVLEYWRFDATGAHHGVRLAGDLLVGGVYVPIRIDPLGPAEEILQGHSPGLNLLLRWERGDLGWHDPATWEHIASFDSERARAERAEARADLERAGRIRAEARADREQAERIQERQRADRERQRADREQAARIQERQRAEHERQRAEQAEARLRELETRNPNP